jgi:hypothetical protein
LWYCIKTGGGVRRFKAFFVWWNWATASMGASTTNSISKIFRYVNLIYERIRRRGGLSKCPKVKN